MLYSVTGFGFNQTDKKYINKIFFFCEQQEQTKEYRNCLKTLERAWLAKFKTKATDM